MLGDHIERWVHGVQVDNSGHPAHHDFDNHSHGDDYGNNYDANPASVLDYLTCASPGCIRRLEPYPHGEARPRKRPLPDEDEASAHDIHPKKRKTNIDINFARIYTTLQGPATPTASGSRPHP